MIDDSDNNGQPDADVPDGAMEEIANGDPTPADIFSGAMRPDGDGEPEATAPAGKKQTKKEAPVSGNRTAQPNKGSGKVAWP